MANSSTNEPEQQDRDWTVMIYMVADDPAHGELLDQQANRELDEIILTAAAKNASDWGLRPNQSKDAYRALYKGVTIKENKDGDKKFVGKINQRRDVFVFDEQRNMVDKEYVTKGSLVKMIVEAHQGSIQVKSAPGQGTEFIVRIPAAEPEPDYEFSHSSD